MIKFKLSYENEKEKLQIAKIIKELSKLIEIKKISKEYTHEKSHCIYVDATIKKYF